MPVRRKKKAVIHSLDIKSNKPIWAGLPVKINYFKSRKWLFVETNEWASVCSLKFHFFKLNFHSLQQQQQKQMEKWYTQKKPDK